MWAPMITTSCARSVPGISAIVLMPFGSRAFGVERRLDESPPSAPAPGDRAAAPAGCSAPRRGSPTAPARGAFGLRLPPLVGKIVPPSVRCVSHVRSLPPADRSSSLPRSSSTADALRRPGTSGRRGQLLARLGLGRAAGAERRRRRRWLHRAWPLRSTTGRRPSAGSPAPRACARRAPAASPRSCRAAAGVLGEVGLASRCCTCTTSLATVPASTASSCAARR